MHFVVVDAGGKEKVDIKGDADTVDGEHAADFADASHTHGAGDITNRTRSFLLQAVHAYNSTDAIASARASDQRGWHLIDGKVTYCLANFCVPSDYVSGLTIKAILISAASGNCYGHVWGNAAAVGEAWDTHQEYPESTALALTADLITLGYTCEITGLSADDYVTVRLARDGTDASDTISDTVFCPGFLLSYTADS